MNNSFANKNILVFGASGYIGSSLVSEIKGFNCKIIRVSRNIDTLKNVSDSCADIINIELDFENKYFLELIKSSDIIYYLSSQTSVYVAEKDILKDYNDSVKPVILLLEKLKEYKNKATLIFSSAVTICGLNDNGYIDEKAQENPITIYDTHKLVIEKYIKNFISKNYIKGCILRLSNIYGPGIKSSSSDRGILNLMIKKALYKDDITLYGDGNFTRDYIFIDDTISAFLQASINIKNTNNKHYIIGSGQGVTIRNAFELIKSKAYELFDISININKVNMPLELSMIEYRNFTADNSSFKEDANWDITVNLESGIEKTMIFFKLVDKNE